MAVIYRLHSKQLHCVNHSIFNLLGIRSKTVASVNQSVFSLIEWKRGWRGIECGALNCKVLAQVLIALKMKK